MCRLEQKLNRQLTRLFFPSALRNSLGTRPTNYIHCMFISFFTGRKTACAAAVGFMPGILPGILSVIGVAMLAQSSFELDAVQVTNG